METVKLLIEECTKRSVTISSCESLTAGLFGTVIASVSGASAVYKGGFITYFTQMKVNLAHVEQDVIDTYGVISKECACSMAKHTQELTQSTLTVSFTGNAGPSSMENKPAGLVYCAIATKDTVNSYEFLCKDMSRNEVREYVVKQMVQNVLDFVRMEKYGKGK